MEDEGSDTQFTAPCSGYKGDRRRDIACFDAKLSANSEVGHRANSESANDSRALGKIGLLSAGAGLPKIILQNIFGHPDAVIGNGERVRADGDFNFAVRKRDPVLCNA
jgi:hypothetical protein